MEMHDLFFLTLQVIVYIPYLLARGKAVQVKRGNEKEWGMCSKTATAINLRHPGNHTYTYDEQCFFSHLSVHNLRAKKAVLSVT